MRHIPLMLVAIVLASTAVVAQDGSNRDLASATSISSLESYVVQLTEFRWKASSDTRLTAHDIVQSYDQLRNDGKLDVIETVRLSTLEHYESMVQFGRTSTVTTGFTQTPQGRSRNASQQQVGTLVRLTVFPQDGSVLLNLAYEATRLSENESEDSPPDTLMTQFKTTLLVKPGKPTLVGGTTAEETSFLLVSINSLDRDPVRERRR